MALLKLLPALLVVPLLLILMLIGGVGGAGQANATTELGVSTPSDVALSDIPENYLRMYQAAAADKGIDWAYLAGIGKIESNHGRSKAVGVLPPKTNFHGCCAGPMQFCVVDGCPDVGSQSLTVAQAQAGTWKAYGVDGNNDDQKNPWDPADAIPAAASYLVASGAPADYRKALLAYNRSSTYVANVIAQADAYRAAAAIQDGPKRVADPAARQRVVDNPNISFGDAVETPKHEASILDGSVDGRIVAVLDWLGKSHTIVISSMRIDRAGTNHGPGRAMDIAVVDGEPCNGSRANACGRLALSLARIQGPLHSSELIYCFDPDGPDNLGSADDSFADPLNHCNHIHFGYDL